MTASCLSTSGLTGGSGQDGAAPADGDLDDPRNNPCGANLRTDKVNCGQCGNVCPQSANGYPECSEGICGHECHTGFGDCDGVNENGCESELAANELHCGRCGRTCMGGDCVANQCQPVVTINVTGRTTGVAVDDGFVYYAFNGASAGSSGIARVPKAEAAPTAAPVVQGQPTITQIAVDDGYVYWATRSTEVTGNGGVHRIRKDGTGGVQAVATGLHTGPEAILKIHDGTVYFSVLGYDAGGFVEGGQIASCPVAGCSPTSNAKVVAEGPNVERPYALALDGRNLYFSTGGSPSGTPVPPAVYECALSNGACAAAPASIRSNTPRAFSVELDARSVYFATSTEVMAVDRSTKALTTLAAGLRQVRAIAVDATHVYWVSFENQGTVQSCAIEGCGGVPRTIASSLAFPHSIATDATALYWTTEGALQATTTSVMKVVK